MLWSVIVPVKLLAEAKSRLAEFAGPYREQLALAVATDTVSAAVRCPHVLDVLVVTDDSIAAPALGRAGARVVSDRPDSGLNPALRHGAAQATAAVPGTGVAALSADLPALRPDELSRALDAAARHDTAFVADAARYGTTLYAATPGAGFNPLFGEASRSRHTTAGAHELRLGGIDSVRTDVDTPQDLDNAIRLGAGSHTMEIVTAMKHAQRT